MVHHPEVWDRDASSMPQIGLLGFLANLDVSELISGPFPKVGPCRLLLSSIHTSGSDGVSKTEKEVSC